MAASAQNIDKLTVEGFGDEWDSFDQTALSDGEWQELFDRYFAIFPFDTLPPKAEGFDLGCGSGRWARGVVDKVGTLNCIDPSDKALAVAKRQLAGTNVAKFHCAGVDSIPLEDCSQDFGYSLGVLHHIPDTAAAMADCVKKLKPGAPFLVYLYYAFDNRPFWFRAIWKTTDFFRFGISRLPFGLRKLVTNVIAALVYWPLARLAGLLERLGLNVDSVPLAPYRSTSFYSMRTDALDRFGSLLGRVRAQKLNSVRVVKPKVLYISYDGMLEPLGQSQVIAYLEKLSDEFEFHIISYEKRDDRNDAQKRSTMISRLQAAGIFWHPLKYHKSPSVPATVFDIMQGIVCALWLIIRYRINFIHARSYIPALIGLFCKRLGGKKLLFDMRGLWPDERVDGRIWQRDSGIYRTVKAIEKILLLASDHIVTLTNSSVSVIRNFPFMAAAKAPISVIPTCANLDRFKPIKGAEQNPLLTLGYLGSVGTWYLFDEVLECFKIIRRRDPAARLLVVNRLEQDMIAGKIAAHDLPAECFELTSASHNDVPALIARMSVGAAIIDPVFSKIASAPTKLAEYLGCGVPCLGNVGVGDMEAILEGEGAGVALTGFTPTEREAAVERLFALLERPGLGQHCREVAEKHFSLDGGVESYRRIYRELLA